MACAEPHFVLPVVACVEQLPAALCATARRSGVVDCCFDLCGTPDLESMIAFCEVFYDWLALDPRHTVLFHAESAAALQRLLILLYSYACFCDSMERKNMNISRCIKEYISGYPNGSVRPSVAFLRYAEYMSLFSPYRRMGLLRATMSIHCIAIFNFPLFADSCISVFFKFYSYSPLRPIYTTAT
ncbi:unnamed protein product [Dibothriocephalus latus]|uniref:Uncharacterized protein n=1 Tax=Dibothriocephalus latus TaxID=60516 RepID=A0A3P6T9S9_DIBLA|nr:unnamed protein product [Dibothriocephalus latus]